MNMTNEKRLTHFEGVGVNVSYQEETQVLVNTALVDQQSLHDHGPLPTEMWE